MMKQLLLFPIALLALLLPATVTAHDFMVNGIYYNISNGNEVEVTYRGNSFDQFSDEYAGDVIIPSSFTYYGITYSVTTIGDYAFYDCDGLTSVTIPNSVANIGNKAFGSCISLTTIRVASDNPRYDSRDNCNAVIETASNTLICGCKNTVIPNSVISIGDNAFSSCYGLTSVIIPNSVTSIGNNAFAYCSGLTSVKIPSSVISIGDYAFYFCVSLTSVNIPNSVTSIGEVAFYACSGLTSVIIPDSVTSIGAGAFGDCDGLTSVTIGNSVITIGGAAFTDCDALASISVASSNPNYDSRGNCNAIIETASNTLICGCKNTEIPNSVTSIGGSAFTFCSSLASVNIPNSVISIGDNAFACCSGLTSVTIGNSVTTIGSNAFYKCDVLTSVTIPNSVNNIDECAFYDCSGLTDVYSYITDLSKVSIEYRAFYLSEQNYSNRTLHVPAGTGNDYQVDENLYPYFGQIVEMVFKGDANIDGIISLDDVIVIIDYVLGVDDDTPFSVSNADLNGNGRVDLNDIVWLIDIMLQH